MSDLADIQQSFDDRLFHVACQDVARVVSILTLEAEDVSRPREKQSFLVNAKEKTIFFMRFFYLVFYKGFTPTVFEMMPYKLWQILTIGIYIYRTIALPIILQLTGYRKYASWTTPRLGSKQPKATDPISKPYAIRHSLMAEGRLSKVNFGDKYFETLFTALYKKGAHLSPHSQSPGHPFIHGFPGNFMDHLLGVYKILMAWKQPQYICRAGLFHSVYGTFDYRASFYDLRDGREEVSGLIGEAAEELAFLICTSDRIGLLRVLLKSMYGDKAKTPLGGGMGLRKDGDIDGNPFPPLIATLGAEGFPVTNHITQTVHVLEPDLFAQFAVVFMADFLEQGALPLGSEDFDLCLFQFLRFRFFNDLLQFVKPYLRVMPPVWEHYMGSKQFAEVTREEVIVLKRLWKEIALPRASLSKVIDETTDKLEQALLQAEFHTAAPISSADRELLLRTIHKCPYLAEPQLILACTLQPEESISASKSSSNLPKEFTRDSLSNSAASLLEQWGMMTIKEAEMKEIISLALQLARK
jgi:hypothetical protein